MHLTEQEIHRNVVLPFEEDRATAARVASFFTLIASAWFCSPEGFYGLAEAPYAWNNVLIGGLMALIACARLIWPRETTFLGYVNMVLGAWVILSPFVLGYVDHTDLLASSIGCGSVVLVMSYIARLNSSRLRVVRSLASDNDAY